MKKNMWKECKKEKRVIEKKWKIITTRRHGIDEGRDKALEAIYILSC
jgi:hypothetical protein